MSLQKRLPRRGGRRAGAGRKPADPSGIKRPVTVWLSPAELARCVELGGFSVQTGIRRLIAESLTASRKEQT